MSEIRISNQQDCPPDGRHLQLVQDSCDTDPTIPPTNLDGGIFYTLPTYSHRIDYTKTSSPRRDHVMDADARYGKWWSERIIMDDGLQFQSHIGQANKPKTDVPIVMTPPWWTRSDAGFNPYVADQLMELGYNVIIKGIPLNRAAPLSRSAFDTHLLLENSDSLDFYDRNRALLTGFSNGAMTGTGTAAYGSGKVFEREIVGGYLVDPCIVRRPQVTDAFTGVHDLRQVPTEVWSLVKQVRRHKFDTSLKIAKTVLPSIDYVKSNVLLGPGLMSGEFGDLLNSLLEDKSSSYEFNYLVFTKSLGNQLKLLRERIPQGHPHLHLEERKGTHLSILNPATIASTVGYFALELDKYSLAA